MSDKRGTMSAGHGNGGLVETMMTADGSRPTAYGLCRMPSQKQSEPLAVSRKPMAERDLPKAKTPHMWTSGRRLTALSSAEEWRVFGIPPDDLRK